VQIKRIEFASSQTLDAVETKARRINPKSSGPRAKALGSAPESPGSEVRTISLAIERGDAVKRTLAACK
jgi:hypothetical protein